MKQTPIEIDSILRTFDGDKAWRRLHSAVKTTVNRWFATDDWVTPMHSEFMQPTLYILMLY